ncbi:MAG: hypothetical protein QT08_C0011G0018 [archaeon GW2011_AR17]|nr:MAG: hypothetical protein QT08_C0011G0018 [archaeon GW2011_AR17]MBS3154475.1 hypothetical protein [Candidatus Woesearchaeota archaeon]HIH15122.1 hypothetical protein [Nanoarchaeota archaeon]HIH59390.1 hypothetical protein [Nanoarchaeota archaeon]HII14522.1 hypothetical protein [Nanoarchaeota archaeon]
MRIFDFLFKNKREERDKESWLVKTRNFEYTLIRNGVNWQIFIPKDGGFRRCKIISFGSKAAGEVQELREIIGKAIFYDAGKKDKLGNTSTITSVKIL